MCGTLHSLGLFDTAPEGAQARDRCVSPRLPPLCSALPPTFTPPTPPVLGRRTSIAALGEPAFAQFFNFPDEAADLVSPDGALHPLPDDANTNTKKFYAANAKGGVTKIHPKMLELWRLHTRASAPGTAETPPAGEAARPARAAGGAGAKAEVLKGGDLQNRTSTPGGAVKWTDLVACIMF